MRWTAVIGMFFACFVVLGAACAVDLYVDPVNGNDANDGSSWSSALRTITRVTEFVGPHTDPVIYLAEGVFSQETGERFPISFSMPPSIIGASPDSSIIDAGSSLAVLENTTHWAGDWLLASLRIEGHAQDKQSLRSSAILNMYGWGASFENVHFVGLSTPGDACIISLDTDGGGVPLELTDCVFLDCDGQWLGASDYYSSPSLTMTRCLFVGSFMRSEYLSPQLVYAGITDCRFIGRREDLAAGTRTRQPYFPGPAIGFMTADELWIANCAFEDITLFVSDGTGWDPWRGDAVGCSFRNSTVDLWNGYGDLRFELCAFDDASDLAASHGSASLRWCCSPFVGDEHHISVSNPIEGPPMFVHGPLGGCYLSNRASGQMFLSPCLSGPNEGYRGWPPEGSTTRTDGVPDEAPYDIGYHYPSVPPPPPAVSVRTDRTEYAVGDQMQAFITYENRGVKVQGAIYFAFGPDTLDWLIFWPWMTFVPTPWVSGTLYSGVSYQNLPPTTNTIPDGLAPGHYLWLGAVLASDGTFASDVALCPVTITAD
ncbi:MAG: DUF1565 domain-containing protein [Candidatus Coatesbacteria bacterium]|nr:DUF1565 domain-containing protein [Candidatus Coatesbacteria bacterium]